MHLPRDKFAAIVAQVSVGIAESDLRGRLTFVNPAFCRMVGRTADEVLRTTVAELTHPDDRAESKALVDHLIATGEAFEVEKRYLRGDGTVVWAATSVAIVQPPDGGERVLLAFSHDITWRKRTQERLLDAEQRYRLAGRATNDVLWDWDRRTGLVTWSESLRAVFGHDPAAANGPIESALAWWGGHIHPDERDAVLGSFTAGASGDADTWAKEYRFLAADGSYRHVIDRGYIDRGADGAPNRMVGSMQDVTALRATVHERDRLVTQLDSERLRFETVLKALPVGVIVADVSGRIIFVNPEVDRIWRRPAMSSTSIADYGNWRGYHPDGRPFQATDWPLARALMYGEVVVDERVSFERGDGSGRGVMQVSAAPIRNAAGELTAGVVIFSDVTERERLHEMAREARAEAEAASRMKDEFLAVLSHELRTPLNAILGWAHMITSESVSPGQVTHGLDVIQRNARAQSKMIEDLLDLSAIVRGKLRLQFEAVDLDRVIHSAVESIRVLAEQKRIGLETIVPEGDWRVTGDAARLQQVIWNLLSNAVKFTPDGGRVTLAVARVADDCVTITVRDTGAGIDPDFLPHVFDRFRQGDVTPTRSSSGLGLGLSIVRHLVEAHGGSISAHSDGPGRGAGFSVWLPALAAGT